jgi:hypothetical protein
MFNHQQQQTLDRIDARVEQLVRLVHSLSKIRVEFGAQSSVSEKSAIADTVVGQLPLPPLKKPRRAGGAAASKPPDRPGA